MHSICITGEMASAVQLHWNSLWIEWGNYHPELILNVDETSLFRKKMPSRTFVSREEKHASGFRATKDRLTFLLAASATGDFK